MKPWSNILFFKLILFLRNTGSNRNKKPTEYLAFIRLGGESFSSGQSQPAAFDENFSKKLDLIIIFKFVVKEKVLTGCDPQTEFQALEVEATSYVLFTIKRAFAKISPHTIPLLNLPDLKYEIKGYKANPPEELKIFREEVVFYERAITSIEIKCEDDKITSVPGEASVCFELVFEILSLNNLLYPILEVQNNGMLFDLSPNLEKKGTVKLSGSIAHLPGLKHDNLHTNAIISHISVCIPYINYRDMERNFESSWPNKEKAFGEIVKIDDRIDNFELKIKLLESETLDVDRRKLCYLSGDSVVGKANRSLSRGVENGMKICEEIMNQKKKNNAFDVKDSAVESQKEKLEKDLKELDNEIAIKEKDEEISNLTNELERLKKEKEEQTKEKNELEANIESQKENLESLENEIKLMKAGQNSEDNMSEDVVSHSNSDEGQNKLKDIEEKNAQVVTELQALRERSKMLKKENAKVLGVACVVSGCFILIGGWCVYYVSLYRKM